MYVLNVFYLIDLIFFLKIDGENFDEFMQELGVGWAMRMAAKAVKPRVIIGENNGKWSIKSESTFKTVAYDFTPGVSFDETTPDGREVTVGTVF
jgi:fatty acid-binding protein 4